MAPPSWVGKTPTDMSDSELRAAKAALVTELEPAQNRLNTVSAAVGQINREINDRFRMTTTVPPTSALPPYPLDDIQTEFGDTPAP